MLVLIGIVVLMLGFSLGALFKENEMLEGSPALRKAKKAWTRDLNDRTAIYMADGFSERRAQEMALDDMQREAVRRTHTKQANA